MKKLLIAMLALAPFAAHADVLQDSITAATTSAHNTVSSSTGAIVGIAGLIFVVSSVLVVLRRGRA